MSTSFQEAGGMSYDEIRRMPTCVDREMMQGTIGGGIHESCLQGYQILQKVKALLAAETSPTVIAELIEMMETPIESDDISMEQVLGRAQ